MSELREKQGGFKVVWAVLILGVGCLVLGALWLTYGHHQWAPGDTSATTAETGQASTTLSAAKSATVVQQSAPVPNQNVERIPELGIQVTVPDSIKDLTYQVRTGTLRNGEQATFAMFSTASLAAADPNCGPSNAPLGTLERAAGQYPSDDQYAALDYGRLVKQFPTFYISAGSPQASCSTQPLSSTMAAYMPSFQSAEPTINELN